MFFVIGSLSGAQKKEKDYQYRSDVERYSTDVEKQKKSTYKSKIAPKKKLAECFDDMVPPTPPQLKHKLKSFHERGSFF